MLWIGSLQHLGKLQIVVGEQSAAVLAPGALAKREPILLFAGEAENRLDTVLRDAAGGRLASHCRRQAATPWRTDAAGRRLACAASEMTKVWARDLRN
jgi:hypothetical protein